MEPKVVPCGRLGVGMGKPGGWFLVLGRVGSTHPCGKVKACRPKAVGGAPGSFETHSSPAAAAGERYRPATEGRTGWISNRVSVGMPMFGYSPLRC